MRIPAFLSLTLVILLIFPAVALDMPVTWGSAISQVTRPFAFPSTPASITQSVETASNFGDESGGQGPFEKGLVLHVVFLRQI